VVVVALAILFSRNWKRILQVASAWGLYNFSGWIYDYLFWGAMLVWFGNLWGSVWCSLGALVINFFLLRWYQKNEKDWLGVNILEEIKAKGHEWAERLCNHHRWYVKYSIYLFAKLFQGIIWCLNKNDVFAFLFLSIWKDSFITTAFLRHGKFGELNRRDYAIFLGSTILSTICWSFGMIIIMFFAKFGWKIMFG
jgi:hypothetical protein